MEYNYYGKNAETTESAGPRSRIRQNPGYYYRTAGLVGTNSFSIVLPKQYAIDLGIGRGDFVKVSQEQNRIVIEKA
jgi:hypothetical protein